MKLSFLISGISLTFFLNACWVQEAPKDLKKEVHIVSDYLTAADSALILKFEKDFKVKVSMSILPADTIYSRIYTQRYNSGIDVLVTDNETLRNKLRHLGAFSKLNNDQLFSKNDRQFYSSHRLWLGITHDPLVLVKSKDTSGYCGSINWPAWHTSDSLRVLLKLNGSGDKYFNQLSEKFPALLDQKRKIAPGETIQPLSNIVILRQLADSISSLPPNPCYYYLVKSRHFVSSLTTVSICKYSPNNTAANAFVNYLNANSWAMANGRNQLAVNKHIRPNWYIENLKVQ